MSAPSTTTDTRTRKQDLYIKMKRSIQCVYYCEPSPETPYLKA